MPLNNRGHPRLYLDLIRKNRNYRRYLLAIFCHEVGHLFVHIASVITVNRLTSGSSTALGAVVLTNTIPKILLSPIGGVLADTFDRKLLMVILDIAVGFSLFGYIAAIKSESISVLYLTTIVRSIFHSFRDPATKSIITLLVNESDLTRATTINSVIFSSMMIVGGLVVGPISASVGIEACYVIDSFAYFISAYVIWGFEGHFSVSHSTNIPDTKIDRNDEHKTTTQKLRSNCSKFTIPIRSFVKKSKEFVRYLSVCGFGIITLLQPTASMVWGGASILNASFAHVDNDEQETSRRLGLLSSCVGVGILIGPIVANSCINVDRPANLQMVCIGSLGIMSIGWLGVANSPNFTYVCLFTAIRTVGSGILWLDSTLLLQKLTAEEMLGRVLSFEYSAALAGSSVTAYITGILEDAGHTNREISIMSAVLGFASLFLWSAYHVCGGGAASKRFNDASVIEEKQGSLEIGPLKMNGKSTLV